MKKCSGLNPSSVAVAGPALGNKRPELGSQLTRCGGLPGGNRGGFQGLFSGCLFGMVW